MNFYPISQISTNISSQQKYTDFNIGFDSPLAKPISPIRRNKVAESAITNVFDDCVRSVTSINAPFQNVQNKTQKYINQFRSENDPQELALWKQKYQNLYKSYDNLSKKLQIKTKQSFKMQQTLNNQTRQIRDLEQDNIQLSSRLNGMMEQQNQRSQRWSNADFGPNNQVNRFYVQELERNIQNLQRQNKRLTQTIMRKVKNSFNY